jgi:anti-sigma regulatory factor (Ser/Thr protein kinase)
MTDEITLTIPRGEEFQQVARLVLGGLALRLDLTIETIEDLQIALGAVLDRAKTDGDVTVSMSPRDGALETRVGPVDVARDLDAPTDGELNLRRVLDAVVDDIEVEGEYVRLTKRVSRGG